MRRFGTATVLGGLLLLGASGSLSASDTPKAPRHARRKAVASRPASTSGSGSAADVKLENLYVDSEIGQVFTVNLGRPDQPAAAGESASLGSVQIYQLGGNEIEPPATTDPADPADSSDSMAPADDDEAAPAQEMAPADAPVEGDEAMEPAADDSSAEPAAEPAAAPEAAPETGQTAAQAPAAKEAPKTPPPAATAPQAPPPPPPPPFR
jgi:hypothetical protein